MSILIRGMEMPKDIEPGLVIEFADGIDGKRYARLYHYRHGGLTEWLEAVPVPPHGRLIDGDAFLAIINDSTVLSDFLKCIINPLIRGEPTVIDAEEGE